MVPKILITSSLLLSVLFSTKSFSQENTLKEDFKETVEYLYKGAGAQFSQKNNLYFLAAAIPSLWYTFDHDDRLSDLYRSKDLPKHIEIAGDLGVVFNFPILPATFYYIGKKNNDAKMVEFAKEYMATLYLTLGESALLSLIPVHERPVQTDLSVWEKAFRGNSSFPSGHVVPFASLFFKTWQFYGPAYAIAPAILTYWTSYQRVQEGRHYVSDVVGGIFFSAFASEGVRAVGKYKDKNSTAYKWIVEKELRVGFMRYQDILVPRVSFTY